jgi:ribosomal protein S18 acetylase RimI-like enzyme
MEARRIGADALDAVLAARASSILRELVAGGAALGWVDPPTDDEVTELLAGVAGESAAGDACLVGAFEDDALLGFGYWTRYSRPTHRPHADIEKVAVASGAQSGGVGRRIMTELIAAAHEARIEVLTLDLRADNARAIALYESLGFTKYGMLARFVAVGDRRYDKLFYALDLR